MNKWCTSFLVVTTLLLGQGFLTQSYAQEPFLGEIRMVGFNFCPRGWAEADGQLLPISENQSLFSLYGTIYGGDGRTTFGLPDLRGRVAIHEGQGPTLPIFSQGSKGGAIANTLTVNQLPSHNHSAVIATTEQAADIITPEGSSLGEAALYNASVPDPTKTLHGGTVVVGNTGGGQSVNNMQPYLTLKFCVSLQGLFPSRD